MRSTSMNGDFVVALHLVSFFYFMSNNFSLISDLVHGHGVISFLWLCSQIVNGKLRRGISVLRHLIGNAAAYVILKGGSGRCTTSVLKATRRCGIPLSSANGTPTEAEAEAFLFVSCILDYPRCCVCNSSVGSCDLVLGLADTDEADHNFT
jgi:hypothetical protein